MAITENQKTLFEHSLFSNSQRNGLSGIEKLSELEKKWQALHDDNINLKERIQLYCDQINEKRNISDIDRSELRKSDEQLKKIDNELRIIQKMLGSIRTARTNLYNRNPLLAVYSRSLQSRMA